ncbi:MAG: RNA 2',3'-cyclic phosphodiesterase [Bacteroidales bacterium]|jgi:2'-5' RNA ligase|nr:RNA 2',3'-cyclic phosphodiesterase [Bacteroidales bacterium]
MKRLFIAVDIDLSNDFKALTRHLQFELRNDSVVWIKSELQHLTLRFLGETSDAKIDSLVNAMLNAAKTTHPFELQLDKIGVFGSKYSPETLWYGFSDFSLFKNLFNKLEEELVQIGFQKNYGNFVPHITVGRINNIDNKKRFWKTIEILQPKFNQTIPVNHFKLIQSKLNCDGPRYKTIYEIKING